MVLTDSVRFFVLPRFCEKADIRLLDPEQESAQVKGKTLFKTLPADFSIGSYERSVSKSNSDFFIVPQSIKALTPDINRYLDAARADACLHGKKLIVFFSGDYAHRIHYDRTDTIVFKATEYRNSRRSNEVIFAPFVEDLGAQMPPYTRSKNTKPTVSFCGYAGITGMKAQVKYHFENTLRLLMGDDVHKRGIYFRKKAMGVLLQDERITTNFIIRNSFSGNLATASLDAPTLRKEYVDSILASDFVLCPKGDANYSSRFFETLSLGRIPVLIDTDMILPFENMIDYSSFIVRVPYTELDRAGEYILERWEALSDAEFKDMQARARAAFQEYLRYDAYFNKALPMLRDNGITAML